MIVGAFFENGVPLKGLADIEKEINELVRSGQGQRTFFKPDTIYHLHEEGGEIQQVENHVLTVLANGRGIYQYVSEKNTIRQVRLPEDQNSFVLLGKTSSATLLLGVVWHVDFFSVMCRLLKETQGSPDCAITSEN